MNLPYSANKYFSYTKKTLKKVSVNLLNFTSYLTVPCVFTPGRPV